jgi:enoyl-CoA hydratase
VCGIGVAKDLIYTGRTIDAEEALRVGLVNDIADPVLEHALQVAHSLTEKSGTALALAKRLVNMAPGALEAEARSFGELFDSPDAKEGLTAFVEKRPPTFPGGSPSRRGVR